MKAVTIDPKRLAVIGAIRQKDLGASSKQGDKILSLAQKRSALEMELHRLRVDYSPAWRNDAYNQKIKQIEAEIAALKQQISAETEAKEPMREAATASGTLYDRCAEYLEGLK